MNRTRALTLGIALPAAVAGAVLWMNPATGSQGAVPAVGTWTMTIDPMGPPPSFPSLISLNRGGTLTESVSGVPAPAVALLQANGVGNGLGAWQMTGSDLSLVFERFLYKDGAFVGRQHVESTGTVVGDSTTQVATATFHDATGAKVGPTVTLDVSGTRLTP
jgi:hypothetical protein